MKSSLEQRTPRATPSGISARMAATALRNSSGRSVPAVSQTVTSEVTLEAVASSGLGVSYTVEGPVVLVENVLTFTGLGEVTVTASQAGDENWFAADPVSVSFEVVKAPAEVMLGGLTQVYDGGAREVEVSTVPEGLTVAVTYDGSEIAPTNVGSYAVLAVVVEML